jgi:hypothetical protein
MEDLVTEISDWAMGITNESYRPEQAGKKALNYIKLQFSPFYTEYFAKSVFYLYILMRAFGLICLKITSALL